MTSSRRIGTVILIPAAILVAGCTPAEAAPFGKLMFGLMVAFLVAIPVVFGLAWHRRR